MPSRAKAGSSKAEVDEFLAKLEHPYKAEIEALRKVMLGSDARIEEGIKWNAPSFRTTEWFATTHLRTKGGIGLILHLGAKVREGAAIKVEDPAGILQWLAKDRAMVKLEGVGTVKKRKAELERIVKQWVEWV